MRLAAISVLSRVSLLALVVTSSSAPQQPCSLQLTSSSINVPPACYSDTTYTFTTAVDGCCVPTCGEEVVCTYKLSVTMNATSGMNCGFQISEALGSIQSLCASSLTYRTSLRNKGCGEFDDYTASACGVTCGDPPGCTTAFIGVSTGRVDCTSCP